MWESTMLGQYVDEQLIKLETRQKNLLSDP
jgi:hypothetical protein